VYIPRHFSVTDLAEIAAFVDAAESADLVTFDGGKPVATLLPVIWDHPDGFAAGPGPQPGPDAPGPGAPAPEGPDAPGRYGRLLGHLARANPQWRTAQPGAQALAIVHGPQAYISPSWYPSTAEHGRMVPTWNYQQVHLTGTVAFHQDPDWLREMVTRLTRRHEEARPHPWRVEDAPAKFIEGQLKAIVGVELAITSVEAKYKLGQNRAAADQAGAAEALRGEPGPDAAVIAGMMSELAAGR
jgi:transcriptional regulator